jgi:hypothetical protein
MKMKDDQRAKRNAALNEAKEKSGNGLHGRERSPARHVARRGALCLVECWQILNCRSVTHLSLKRQGVAVTHVIWVGFS